MANHWTIFSEYIRGIYPGDMSAPWASFDTAYVDGVFCDMPHRNMLRMAMSASSRRALLWGAPGADIGLVQQETLTEFRMLGPSLADGTLGLLRGSGAAGTENGYSAGISTLSANITLRKYVNGVNTLLGSSAALLLRTGGIYRQRFRVEGTVPPYTLMVKVWQVGDAEPAWMISLADSSIVAAGLPGLMWNTAASNIEVLGFAAATNGDVAVIDNGVYIPMDSWITNRSSDLEITARFNVYDPAIAARRDIWLSTHGRETSADDYPPATLMNPFLKVDNLGTLSVQVESDAQLSGLATPERSTMELYNEPYYPGGPGPLSDWSSYSFYGNPVEVRIGRREIVNDVLTPHRRFEPIGCAVTEMEPDIVPDKVSVRLGTPLGMLQSKLQVRKHRGIPTGVRNLSSLGVVTIPSNAAYDLTSYNISTALYVPATGFAGSGFAEISKRENGSGYLTWFIGIGQASNATVPNHLRLACHNSAGVVIIQLSYNLTPLLNTVSGSWFDITFCVKGGARWYAQVNTKVVGSGVLTSSPITNAGQPVKILAGGCVSGIICDHRIEYFTEEDEAASRFAARRDPDSLTIAMHRFDDGAGNTVTDYSLLANHGTLGGTNNVDREWVPTNLGSLEIAGNSMPMVAGTVFHAPTVPIDPSRDRHRYHDGVRPTALNLGIRAQGLLLTLGVGYSEPVGAPGVVAGIGTTLSQPVTFGTSAAAPESTSTHLVQVIADELVARGSATTQTIDLASFAALRKYLPMKGGFSFNGETPTVAELLTSKLGTLGAYYSLDGRRLYASMVVPPMLPDYWGEAGPVLEMVGHENRGLTLNWHTGYALNSSANNFSIQLAVRINGKIIDTSTSSTFTYFPTGIEFASNHNLFAAQGWYIGIDGRNGDLIFSTPGQTNLVGGAHYTAIPYAAWHSFVVKGSWLLLRAIVNANQRTLIVLNPVTPVNVPVKVDTVSGSYTPATGWPIRIGNGLTGAVSHFVASSPGYGSLSGYGVSAKPTIQANERIFLPLTEGAGDTCLEEMQGRLAYISGSRWCPKMVLDLDQAIASNPPDEPAPGLMSNRRAVPAWRIEGQYRVNTAPISGANVVSSVSAADRQALARPYLSISDSSETIRLAYLQSKDLTIGSGLINEDDIRVVEELIKRRASTESKILSVGNWSQSALRLRLGDEVMFKTSQIPAYAGGIFVRVASHVFRMSELLVDIGMAR